MNMLTEKQIVNVVRWVARALGVLLLVEVAAFAIGEGAPNPFSMSMPLPERLLTLAFLAMLIGLIAAWRWEGLGSLLILGAFALFLIVNHGIRLNALCNPVFGPWLVIGLLFLFCWWRTPKIR